MKVLRGNMLHRNILVCLFVRGTWLRHPARMCRLVSPQPRVPISWTSHYSTSSEFCAYLESYPRFDQWSFSQPLLIGSSLLLCQSTDTSIWLPHSKPGLSMAKQAKHVFVSYSLTTTVTAIAARQYYRKSNCMSTSKLLSNQTLFDLLKLSEYRGRCQYIHDHIEGQKASYVFDFVQSLYCSPLVEAEFSSLL